MERLISFLEEHPSGFLATVERGLPRVRPWEFMLERERRLYFCTSKQKDVCRQLTETPWVEFSSLSPDMRWVRVRGQVAFTDDIALKQLVMDTHSSLAVLYQTPENPVFTLFYLEHGEAYFGDFSGNPYVRVDF